MSNVLSIDPESIPTPRLHRYLLASVAPRPIAFASTIDGQGRVNLSPFSFFNCFGSNPPIMIFSSARRVRDNSVKHTYLNVKEVPEVVINIVNFSIVEQMSLASTEYEKGINEFVKAGLAQVPSDKIRPPRVGEAPIAFECVVEKIIETGAEGGAGSLIISRVVRLHIREEYLDENQNLDSTRLDLVGRMGGSWYCRASGSALFEIPKPLRTRGIGIDQLPPSVRNSDLLTGNNLGRLGNVEQLPSEVEIIEWKKQTQINQIIRQQSDNPQLLKKELHLLAKNYLEKGDTQAALKTLLVFETI